MTNEAMKKLGNTVREARKRKNVALHEMGKALGIDTSQLCRIESGERVIETEYIYAFSEYLGIPVEDLVVKELISPTPKIEKPTSEVKIGEKKENEKMMKIGRTIREARRKKEMTLNEMGRALGISPTHLCRIERGFRILDAEYIYTFSEYLGIPIEDLIVK